MVVQKTTSISEKGIESYAPYLLGLLGFISSRPICRCRIDFIWNFKI